MARIIKTILKILVLTLFIYDIFDFKINREVATKENNNVIKTNNAMDIVQKLTNIETTSFYIEEFIYEFNYLFGPEILIDMFPPFKWLIIKLNTNILVICYYSIILTGLFYLTITDNLISVTLLLIDVCIKLYTWYRVYISNSNFTNLIEHLKLCLADFNINDFNSLYNRHQLFTENNQFLFLSLVYAYLSVLISIRIIKKILKQKISIYKNKLVALDKLSEINNTRTFKILRLLS